jgi:uncharacterized protein YprB with RNaseH-like and TPR domain
MKSAVFDIETTALEAIGAGIVTCVCIRPLSTHRTRDFRLQYREDWKSSESGFLEVEEKELLQDVVCELSKYDMLIGQNSEQFDLPYLRSRCFRRGLAFPLTPYSYDVMKMFGRTKFRTVMNHFGRPSKSLGMIADFLGIAQEKTALYPVDHWVSIWGNAVERETAMQETLAHCQKDVRMTAKAYEILLPYDYKGIIRRWM